VKVFQWLSVKEHNYGGYRRFSGLLGAPSE
jgi:hypothetical protein